MGSLWDMPKLIPLTGLITVSKITRNTQSKYKRVIWDW